MIRLNRLWLPEHLPQLHWPLTIPCAFQALCEVKFVAQQQTNKAILRSRVECRSDQKVIFILSFGQARRELPNAQYICPFQEVCCQNSFGTQFVRKSSKSCQKCDQASTNPSSTHQLLKRTNFDCNYFQRFPFSIPWKMFPAFYKKHQKKILLLLMCKNTSFLLPFKLSYKK